MVAIKAPRPPPAQLRLAPERSPRTTQRAGADRLGCQLMIVARRWRQALDNELEADGLSHATWRPLLKLSRAASPLRQHELAEQLQVSGPELVRLIDHLERKRLVVRHEAEGDRRAKRLELTPLGRQRAEAVEATIEEFDRRVLRGVSAADRARLRALFAVIEGRLDDLPAPTTPPKPPKPLKSSRSP